MTTAYEAFIKQALEKISKEDTCLGRERIAHDHNHTLWYCEKCRQPVLTPCGLEHPQRSGLPYYNRCDECQYHGEYGKALKAFEDAGEVMALHLEDRYMQAAWKDVAHRILEAYKVEK
jgi:hypothetical protein